MLKTDQSSAIDSFRRFLPPGRRNQGRGSGRRRYHPCRRHGRTLRAEHHHRSADRRSGPPVHETAARRASHDHEPGAVHRRFCEGRGRLSRRACRDRVPPAPARPVDQRAQGEGSRSAQSRDAALGPRSYPSGPRYGRDHVGEPRVRRPVVHSVGHGQDPPAPASGSMRRG